MKDFTLQTYNPSAAQPGSLYLLSRGMNTGKPGFEPWRNSYVLFCDPVDLYKYYWCIYGMWQAKAFRQYLRGTCVQYISIGVMKTAIVSTMAAFSNINRYMDRLQAITALELNLLQKIKLIEALKQSLLRSA
ncbi:hypothetical protein WJU16_22330 [Chitinophaga pollutisoli]|uniref:Type I restriction modification DNA specificity domain-containing protein n=1 Tax=Chitinophaga pollutisoli TaxID=3133966 RepID=A0ABZ2YLR6_9BACT|nr:hypothetical protein [Chitinophaga rhizosphaerae]